MRQRYVLPEATQRELRQSLERLCDKAFRVLTEEHTAIVARDQRNLGIVNSRCVVVLFFRGVAWRLTGTACPKEQVYRCFVGLLLDSSPRPVHCE